MFRDSYDYEFPGSGKKAVVCLDNEGGKVYWNRRGVHGNLNWVLKKWATQNSASTFSFELCVNACILDGVHSFLL